MGRGKNIKLQGTLYTSVLREADEFIGDVKKEAVLAIEDRKMAQQWNEVKDMIYQHQPMQF